MNGVTPESMLAELPGVQVDGAAGDVHLARPRLSDRRTDWRDLASASLVMQHVLITCSSASASGDLGVPARQQRVAGEHRVRLGDLAAEELDRERCHLRPHGSAAADTVAASMATGQRMEPLATGAPSYSS